MEGARSGGGEAGEKERVGGRCSGRGGDSAMAKRRDGGEGEEGQ